MLCVLRARRSHDGLFPQECEAFASGLPYPPALKNIAAHRALSRVFTVYIHKIVHFLGGVIICCVYHARVNLRTGSFRKIVEHSRADCPAKRHRAQLLARCIVCIVEVCIK